FIVKSHAPSQRLISNRVSAAEHSCVDGVAINGMDYRFADKNVVCWKQHCIDGVAAVYPNPCRDEHFEGGVLLKPINRGNRDLIRNLRLTGKEGGGSRLLFVDEHEPQILDVCGSRM